MTKARILADYVAGGTTAAEFDYMDGVTSNVQTQLDRLPDQGEPHIIPGVLYPAVAGKLLDGSTSHSGAYGTAQADGFSYYYTDIKGSRPIKDPRIGAHFGSQRYRLKSVQILEQETATHGDKVYSVDGREHIRIVSAGIVENNSSGNKPRVSGSTDHLIEIVGYWTDANVLIRPWTGGNDRGFTTKVDGGSVSSEINTFNASTTNPLTGRYVDDVSLANLGLSQTLGIHTLRISPFASGDYIDIGGIELIAQDTSNVNNIQIPSQNVVSAGKKFTVSGTPHYNPFAFKTDGTTAWTSGNHNGTAWPVGTGSSANIDTATSLGLAAWVSTNYYYPYNGGRVVWWVDSSGTLKCSVNMMPPNARNRGTGATHTVSTAVAEKGDDSAGTSSAAVANNTYLPTFTDQAIDHSQAEVAKTFHWREFGNGSANGNATYADASMVNGADDIAYVMDDGLTSLSADDWKNSDTYGFIRDAAGDDAYFTFIGTGLSMDSQNGGGINTIAQNLPYGTHIFKIEVDDSTSSAGKWIIDGVEIKTDFNSGGIVSIYEYGPLRDISFHQPKKPPIPEDAVVIADYMLMADFVPQTAHGTEKISKGARRQNISRDFFIDSTNGAFVLGHGVPIAEGWQLYLNATVGSATSTQVKLPSFATTWVSRADQADAKQQLYLDGTIQADGVTTRDNGAAHGSYQHITTPLTLGVYSFEAYGVNGNADSSWTSFDVATPIHTSSHYQTFETPFLHELVGGDRNMEQTNLVVTPDGKTWDEVTRDTSYIENLCVRATVKSDQMTQTDVILWGWWRGPHTGDSDASAVEHHNKNFAIAYDRVICLKAGVYNIFMQDHENTGMSSSGWYRIKKNNQTVSQMYQVDANYGHINTGVTLTLKRGDYIQGIGAAYQYIHSFEITESK